MSASDAYARITAVGMPTLETSDVAALLRMSTPATSMLLTRLATSGLVSRIRPGLWLVSRSLGSRYALAEPLTSPFPSYVSLQTALYLHGMIEQVPSVIYLVSLARTQRISTSVGVYSVHHLTPDLFDGFEDRADGTKVATPEKALFDIAYLSGGRSRLFAHLPELEIPKGFRRSRLPGWTARIVAARRRSMVEHRLHQMLEQARLRAAREAGATASAAATAATARGQARRRRSSGSRQ